MLRLRHMTGGCGSSHFVFFCQGMDLLFFFDPKSYSMDTLPLSGVKYVGKERQHATGAAAETRSAAGESCSGG